MFEWLTHFWYHLHNTEGLKETIQMGGMALLFLIIFTETGLLVGFFYLGIRCSSLRAFCRRPMEIV